MAHLTDRHPTSKNEWLSRASDQGETQVMETSEGVLVRVAGSSASVCIPGAELEMVTEETAFVVGKPPAEVDEVIEQLKRANQ